MFFKTEADRASAQAAKARHDAGEAGSSAATGARNLGAAVLATLAEATAPADDRKGKRHAQKVRAEAVKAARRDREAAAKAAAKAAAHGRKAAELGRSVADKKAGTAGGALTSLADAAGHKAVGAAATAAGGAKAAGSQLAHRVGSSELADKAREKAAHARESAVHAAERTGPMAESAKERAAAGAALVAALAAAAREKADETRARAMLGVEHGLDTAVPRAQEGVAAVGPRVDHLRDVINEELLPKIQEMLADVQTSKDSGAKQGKAAAAAPATKRKRKGGALIAFGLLAAAGAGIAWYLNQQQRQGATDPWASQAGGADPWASRTPTSAAGTASATVTPTTPAPTTSGAEPTGSVAGGSATTDGPRLLESDEIDALASDDPATAAEQTPGEAPTEEIRVARQEAGPAATDVDAGQVDEGSDAGRAPRA